MYKVVIEKECGCFKKSGVANNQEFASKDNALIQAMELTKDFNGTFCQKHEFKVVDNGNDILIRVDERAKSGCCGGGHCS